MARDPAMQELMKDTMDTLFQLMESEDIATEFPNPIIIRKPGVPYASVLTPIALPRQELKYPTPVSVEDDTLFQVDISKMVSPSLSRYATEKDLSQNQETPKDQGKVKETGSPAAKNLNKNQEVPQGSGEVKERGSPEQKDLNIQLSPTTRCQHHNHKTRCPLFKLHQPGCEYYEPSNAVSYY